jgi:exopolysaccharide production protein ExoZ
MFAATRWLWRGFQPGETFGFFLYSATLLPTDGTPFYDLGWSLQHEMAFYLIVAAVVPMFGLMGLALFLSASTLAFHLIDMPWYLSTLASHHGEFLAGVVAFIAREKTTRVGFAAPALLGALLMGFFAVQVRVSWFPPPAILADYGLCKSGSACGFTVAKIGNAVG